VLVGIDGKLDGEIYRLYAGDNKLGRGQDCDLHLLDPQISREHATVIHEDGVFAVLPLSDKNPVFINDERVEDGCELSDGDKLRLGNPGSSSFRFRSIQGP
jgi:predicted component of type VI protein secretion system